MLVSVCLCDQWNIAYTQSGKQFLYFQPINTISNIPEWMIQRSIKTLKSKQTKILKNKQSQVNNLKGPQ